MYTGVASRNYRAFLIAGKILFTRERAVPRKFFHLLICIAQILYQRSLFLASTYFNTNEHIEKKYTFFFFFRQTISYFQGAFTSTTIKTYD